MAYDNNKPKMPRPGSVYIDRKDIKGEAQTVLGVSLDLIEMKDQLLAAINSGEKYFRLKGFKNTYKRGENDPDYVLRYPKSKDGESGTKAVTDSVDFPL